MIQYKSFWLFIQYTPLPSVTETEYSLPIQYYASLAKQHGGKITGRYRNAIYFIVDEDHHYSSMDMSIATEPFWLVEKPHAKRVEGFPLDSLSMDIASGKYYYDLTAKDVSTSVDDGVRKFFSEILRKS